MKMQSLDAMLRRQIPPWTGWTEGHIHGRTSHGLLVECKFSWKEATSGDGRCQWKMLSHPCLEQKGALRPGGLPGEGGGIRSLRNHNIPYGGTETARKCLRQTMAPAGRMQRYILRTATSCCQILWWLEPLIFCEMEV